MLLTLAITKTKNEGDNDMDLIVLLDASDSMDDKLYDDLYGYEKKINLVRNYITTFIQDSSSKDITAIHLYTFSNTLKHIYTIPDQGQMTLSQNDLINSAVDKINKNNIDCSGGTRIWDSLMSLINLASNDSNSKILLCVTDGADGGSSYTYDSVKLEMSKYPNLELLILDIDGKLNSVNDKKDKIIQTIKKPQDIKKVLKSSGLVKPQKNTGESLNITVSVMPVIPCDEDEISMVYEAVREIVPYIEQLTGLRYYPVPTYIVDEYTLIKCMNYPVPDRINNDEDLKSDIDEFFRFFLATRKMISDYYNNYYFSSTKGVYFGNQWDKYFKCTNDLVALIIKCSSDLLYVCNHIISNISYDKYDPILTKYLQDYKDEISKYEAIMIVLKQYLRFINDINNYSYNIDPKYFDECDGDRGFDMPVLEIWGKHLKTKDFKLIQNCLQLDGSWKKDLDSIINVFEVALPTFIKLLRQWAGFRSKWYKVSREIRTFGVYLHQESYSTKLNEIFIHNNFPPHYKQNQGGKVLICLERCKKRLENIIDDETQDDSIDAKDLFTRLIKSTIIHEHTHAITYEGVGTGLEPYYKNKVSIGGKKYQAVSETLAEWAELNYFRIHGDKELYNIVFNHANSDQFPDWAYAGALILERPNNDLPAEVQYRTLLEYFRFNTNVAYRLLRA